MTKVGAQRSKVLQHLAQRRSLSLNGNEVARTPLLVPSFSSKGFADVGEIVRYSSELIDSGAVLVSAYDLHYEHIKPPFFGFADLLFLDSGGYEASKDADLSDYGDRQHVQRDWTQEMHEAQIRAWKPKGIPSVVISYDHPRERLNIKAQIARARAMAPGRTDVMREFLIKPETPGQALIQMKSLLKNVQKLRDFDIIGVTEKEIGNSILARMQNIASLRRALEREGINVPIHIFGSLDTATTPLYFLAGADVFDGLTWLRFAFHKGQTIYKQNFGALEFPISTQAHVIDGLCWNRNYYYIKELQLQMRRFLNAHDFDAFEYHRSELRAALESVLESEGVQYGR
jgi:hypothetical protein